jgi:hypothetical protein
MAVNDLCLTTIEINLLPAIEEYVKVMKLLLDVFTFMRTDADAI